MLMYCPGQYVKRYPSGVLLENQNVIFALRRRTEYPKRVFFCC